MRNYTRRELLKLGTAAAAAELASLSLHGCGVSKLVQSVAPGCSKISDIEHVVILTQENRSFDHYFGKLPGGPWIFRSERGVPATRSSKHLDLTGGTTSAVSPGHLSSECIVHARHQPRLGPPTSELGQWQDGRFREFASAD